MTKNRQMTRSEETVELLPCPFCGGSEQRVKSSGRWGWFVSCSCAAVGPGAGSRDEAIVAWNTRVEPKQMRLGL